MDNGLDKLLLVIKVGRFNITVEFGFFMNPWQDTRFSNSYGMPIPSNVLKLVYLNVGLHEMALKVFDLHDR